MENVERGMIFLVNFGNQKGSCQSGLRPAVIISNRMANKYSPVVMVCPITSKFSKKELPTHVKINKETAGMKYESQVLAEQIYPVNKIELKKYIGKMDNDNISKLNMALEISIEVGKATDIFNDNANEIRMINEKVASIQQIDNFIIRWLDGGRNIQMITDDIQERAAKIKELKCFCNSCKLNYMDYYNPLCINQKSNIDRQMIS